MPGFVVLGVRPGRIEQRARVLVKAQERRLKKCPTPASTETRFAKAVERVRAAPPRIELSPEYSAPQFAIDWARLAMKSGFEALQVAWKYDDGFGTAYSLTEQQP